MPTEKGKRMTELAQSWLEMVRDKTSLRERVAAGEIRTGVTICDDWRGTRAWPKRQRQGSIESHGKRCKDILSPEGTSYTCCGKG